MIIKTFKQDILAPLLKVLPVINQRSPLPVLACALIDFKHGTITGTDLGVQIVAKMDPMDGGSILVDGNKLASVLKLLPDEAVTITIKDAMTVQSGRSRYKLNILDASAFPEFTRSAGREYELEAEELAAAIKHTAYAMGKQDVRGYLNALHIAGDTVEASDGHRLARYTLSEALTGVDVLLPRESVQMIAKAIPKDGIVGMTVDHTTVAFDFGTIRISTKVVEGRFPQVERVIPKDVAGRATMQAELLAAALSRVLIASSETTHGIQLEINDTSIAVYSSNGYEEARDEVQAETGNNMTIVYNGTYMTDMLAHHHGEVTLEFSDNGVAVIRSERTISLAMPMRLSKPLTC